MGQDVNLARKVAVQNAGCIFAYLCGGHKDNFPIWFRSSFTIYFQYYERLIIIPSKKFFIKKTKKSGFLWKWRVGTLEKHYSHFVYIEAPCRRT